MQAPAEVYDHSFESEHHPDVGENESYAITA
jgi:hypothetical protein